MRRRLGLLLLFGLVAASVSADQTLEAPVPLAPSPPAKSAGEQTLTLLSARRAQELGFTSLAADLYRDYLEGSGGGPTEVKLALVNALLDLGQAGEAQRLLNTFKPPVGSDWHLRMALVAAQQSNPVSIRAELDDVRPQELSAADLPWYYFLEGQLAAAAKNPDLRRAGDLYRLAEQKAPTGLEGARFLVAEDENEIYFRPGSVKQDLIDKTRQEAANFQGTARGYELNRSYAAMLNAIGRRAEAVATLQRQLAALPAEEKVWRDEFRLLLGIIAGAKDGPGRSALTQLLESGADSTQQRKALKLLADASLDEPARSRFRSELDRLAAAPSPHPLLDDILLYRAEFALGDRDFAGAEDDAHALLEKFPASPLRVQALGILARAAWEQLRFRTAADYANQAREAVPANDIRARAMLGALVAEARFRAGLRDGDPTDFRNAADAYDAVLREPSPGIPVGELMFQRVQAQIDAGDLAGAEAKLDQFSSEPEFDPVDRWEAEWNLARGLQSSGRSDEAYARVNKLLASPAGAAALPPELKVRMIWLQARLSLDAHEYVQAQASVAELRDSVGALPPDLRSDIASDAGLLQAQADFALNLDSVAHGVLERLRSDFPGTKAAIYSYFVEADRDAEQDRVVEAQRLLTQLADLFPSSPYAPYALYQAALQAERLGQQKNFKEANELLERLVALVKRYPPIDPAGDLVFDARLKQGDLMRQMNDYAAAERDYEYLVRDPAYSQRPDSVLAQLALAECYNAQSVNDASRAELAMNLFSHLCERIDAPADVRAEAGFNLGSLLERRGQPRDATVFWWRDVVTALLLDPKWAGQLGPNGRYWMSRTLDELGDLELSLGHPEEAKQAWRLILDQKLPYDAVAREKLAPFGITAKGSGP